MNRLCALLTAISLHTTCIADAQAPKPKAPLVAKLALSKDHHFESKWNCTAGSFGVTASSTHTACRGESVFVLLFLGHPAISEEGEAHVTFDLTVTKPTGEEYFSQENLEALDGPVEASVALWSHCVPEIRFEQDDPFGDYTVNVVVRDRIDGTHVTAEESVTLVAFSIKGDKMSTEEIETRMAEYYLNPDPPGAFAFFRLMYIEAGKPEKQYLALYFAETFRAIVEDNPFLLPHFEDYFKDRAPRERYLLLPTVTALSRDHRGFFERVNLTKEEREELYKIEYPDLWDEEFAHPGELDMLWVNFFATGDIKPIRQLVAALSLGEKEELDRAVIGKAAAWSLGSNCEQHRLVKAYCAFILDDDQQLSEFTRKTLGESIKGVVPSLQPPKNDQENQPTE